MLLWNDLLAVNQCSPIEWDSNGHATLFAVAAGLVVLDESEVVGADDLNLVYVAATRAKQRLIVSDALKHLITAPRCRFATTWYLRRDTNLPTTEMIAVIWRIWRNLTRSWRDDGADPHILQHFAAQQTHAIDAGISRMFFHSPRARSKPTKSTTRQPWAWRCDMDESAKVWPTQTTVSSRRTLTLSAPFP